MILVTQSFSAFCGVNPDHIKVFNTTNSRIENCRFKYLSSIPSGSLLIAEFMVFDFRELRKVGCKNGANAIFMGVLDIHKTTAIGKLLYVNFKKDSL